MFSCEKAFSPDDDLMCFFMSLQWIISARTLCVCNFVFWIDSKHQWAVYLLVRQRLSCLHCWHRFICPGKKGLHHFLNEKEAENYRMRNSSSSFTPRDSLFVCPPAGSWQTDPNRSPHRHRKESDSEREREREKETIEREIRVRQGILKRHKTQAAKKGDHSLTGWCRNLKDLPFFQKVQWRCLSYIIAVLFPFFTVVQEEGEKNKKKMVLLFGANVW